MERRKNLPGSNWIFSSALRPKLDRHFRYFLQTGLRDSGMRLQKWHSEHPIRSNRPQQASILQKRTVAFPRVFASKRSLHKLSEKIDGLLADDPDTGEPCVEAIPHSSARARIKDETVAVRGLSAVRGFVPMILDELREGFVPWVGRISREDLVE
jgi:hypothetical protein